MSKRKFRPARMILLSACAAVALTPVAASAQAGGLVQYRIEAQDLGSALTELARQSKREIYFSSDLTRGRHAPSVRGQLTVEQALGRLLQGSGLSYRINSTGAIAIVSTGGNGGAAGEVASSKGEGGGVKEQNEGSQQQAIVVTGSHIRGASIASPVITISQRDMRLAGQHDLGEVIRGVPQNFSGGQNPGVLLGATGGSAFNVNVTGSSTLNLRGLGADATLTLLDGVRMPFDGAGQATSIAVVPLAAIDRMEIMLGGASAIYGSDAVGGVANVILKRDYRGLEVSARYGGATDGGDEQTQFTAVGGANWGSGGFILAGDYSRNTAVTASQRDYLAYMPSQFAVIYPKQRNVGGLLSGHQALGDQAEFAIDAFYTKQNTFILSPSTIIVDNRPETTIWMVAPSLTLNLLNPWSLRIQGAFGKNQGRFQQRLSNLTTGAQLSQSAGCNCNDAQSASLEAEGPLIALPGGDARLSVGAGYRRNHFASINLITGLTPTSGTRQSHFGYAEVNLPFIGDYQHIPFVNRLTLNAAIRYEDYGKHDFGSITTPKIGLIWSPTAGFELKGSWGRSFKTPLVSQQFLTPTLALYPATSFSGGQPGKTIFLLGGGNPNLEPERARVFTAGFVVAPSRLAGLHLEANWFNIRYADRVINPITPVTQGLINPAFAPFVILNPTVAEQNAAIAAAAGQGPFSNFTGLPYNPATVIAVLDNQAANSAVQRTHGIDLSARYAFDLLHGQFVLSGNATWLKSKRRLTLSSGELPASGIIYFPPNFRGRLGAVWSNSRLSLASYVNRIGGVNNTNIIPNPEGRPWTTIDLTADYRFKTNFLHEIELGLSATNVLNQRPPYLQPTQPYLVDFDSTNYSPLGRTVSATATVRF